MNSSQLDPISPTDSTEEINIFEARMAQLIAEKEVLEQRKNSLLQYREKLKKDIPSYNFPSMTFHDIVIIIDSLKEICWRIDYNLSAEKHFLIAQEGQKESKIVIGALGREKVGKTFLLGKITNLILPEGYDQDTEGLSVDYSTKDNILTICLDSAGLNRPVYYNNQEAIEKILSNKLKLEEVRTESQDTHENFRKRSQEYLLEKERNALRLEMINDKKISEAFIEDFILHVSKVVLVVVGILSREDQILIERVKREYKGDTQIIIIHNFSMLSSEESLMERVKKDVVMSFQVREEIIPKTDLIYYVEDLENPYKAQKYLMRHFIVAQENTNIGNTRNQVTIEYIWTIIKGIEKRMDFEIIKDLKKFFQENWSKYLKVPHYLREKKLKKLELYQENNFIRLHNPDKLELATQDPIFTALGSMIIRRQYDLDPLYEIREFYRDKIQYFICYLEIPNLDMESLRAKIIRMPKGDDRVLLKIRGEKFRDKKINNNECLFLESNCIFGKFKKTIEIGNTKDNYDFEGTENPVRYFKRKGNYEDGVAGIEYRKNPPGNRYTGFIHKKTKKEEKKQE